VVVAVAQLYRVSVGSATPNLPFEGLRLVGLVAVLVGLGQLVTCGLRRLQTRNWDQQEELSAAVLHLERAREMSAERDHELRNGLAGLAGVTHLLSADLGEVDHEPLRQAVLRELGRMLALVDGDRSGAQEYLVEQVLAERVELRRSAGAAGVGAVELRTERDLRVAGDPDVLAQVITNLLVNCDRHARGAPITVTAARRGPEVVVDVRDHGPGLPAGVSGESLLERGARDAAAGGEGLGLHISAELLARVEDPRLSTFGPDS
jgi:two-component system OmpR family sensor kinase